MNKTTTSQIIFVETLQWLGEKLSPGVAWVDLQLMLSDSPKALSVRSLAARWKWSKDRVSRFLAKLEGLSLLGHRQGQEQGHQQGHLYYLNTDTYIGECDTRKDTNKDTCKDTEESPLNGPSPIPTLPLPPTPPITHTPVTTPPIIPQEARDSARTRKKVFTPPTVDEVRQYCTERGNDIDPQDFVDFYSTNGWVQGKKGKPIVDWKACVRTWENARKNQQRGLFSGNSSSSSATGNKPAPTPHVQVQRNSPEQIAHSAFYAGTSLQQTADFMATLGFDKPTIDNALRAAGYSLL